MNAIIQSQLDRVESALANLIDSIAAYNPSVPAASTLLAADDELQKGLKQLAQHQANHARILALHEKIDQQNAQITSTITALADTRTDLLSAPTSLPPKDLKDVPYKELLDYAKRISRYTVPPTFRPPLPPAQTQIAAEPTPPVNGENEAPKEGVEGSRGRGTEALEDEERKWLEPLMQMQWVPWVNDDTMRRGALAQIQAMVERGEDLTAPKPEDATEEESKEEGERMEDVVREEATHTGDRDAQREVKRDQKLAVFSGLDLYDPDEDED